MPETETENPVVEPQDVGSETVEQLPSELMDMIIADESPSNISDRIKDMLYAKSAERVDAYRPTAVNSLFGSNEEETVETDEVEDSVSDEEEVVAVADGEI